jgi:hypothetical protein
MSSSTLRGAAILGVFLACTVIAGTEITSWPELAQACSNAAATTTTLSLSRSFQMQNYTGTISLDNKHLVILGNNAILDADGKGRFFILGTRSSDRMGDDDGAGSSLELRDLTLQNGNCSLGNMNRPGFCDGDPKGGAISATGGSRDVSVRLRSCVFQHNIAYAVSPLR